MLKRGMNKQLTPTIDATVMIDYRHINDEVYAARSERFIRESRHFLSSFHASLGDIRPSSCLTIGV